MPIPQLCFPHFISLSICTIRYLYFYVLLFFVSDQRIQAIFVCYKAIIHCIIRKLLVFISVSMYICAGNVYSFENIAKYIINLNHIKLPAFQPSQPSIIYFLSIHILSVFFQFTPLIYYYVQYRNIDIATLFSFFTG